MAARESSGLYIYRVSVIVRDKVAIRYVHGWNDQDALRRLQARLTEEGHPLATLNILDRRPL